MESSDMIDPTKRTVEALSLELDRVNAENESARKKIKVMEDALLAISGYMDQDGYGKDAWKNLAKEMGDIASEALTLEGAKK